MARSTKAPALVTKQSLAAMIDEADHARTVQIIGRALVVLFNRQTAGEQSANSTDQDNSRGFASADARGGSLSAKSFIKRGTLESWQVAQWTRPAAGGFPRICKYHRQLNEAAMERAAARVGQQQSLLV